MIRPTASERQTQFFPTYRPRVAMAFCGNCDRGLIYLDALEHGWVRKPELDTAVTDGYLTPGGQRFDHPKGMRLLTYTLCDCVRAAHAYPSRVVHEAQEDRSGLDWMLKTRRAG